MCALVVATVVGHLGLTETIRCAGLVGTLHPGPVAGALPVGVTPVVSTVAAISRPGDRCSGQLPGPVQVEACPARQAVPPLLVLLLLSVFQAGGLLLPAPGALSQWAPGVLVRLPPPTARRRRALLQVFRN